MADGANVTGTTNMLPCVLLARRLVIAKARGNRYTSKNTTKTYNGRRPIARTVGTADMFL
jgi:hypothetical protein